MQVARLSQTKFEVEVCDYVRVDMGDITADQTELVKEKLDQAMADYIKSKEQKNSEPENTDDRL